MLEDVSGSGSCGLFRIKELISSRRQRRLSPSAPATPSEVVRRVGEAGATEWRSMRVTVSHSSRKEEIVRSVDRSFDDLFKGFGTVPIQIVNESRKWTGSRMDFSFDAKVGIVSTPIKGFVDVTDKDVTVDADLGWLERLFPAKQAQAALEGRVKGLLT
jgi:hypothetical protein